jgi:DNA-directed RNA polymerase specialized sigma24 family protein
MSPFPNEWSFLSEAWKFALVLTGREAAATSLVSSTLAVVAKRADLHEKERTTRVFFSLLRRAATPPAAPLPPETDAERRLFFLHQLPGPAREAISLLYLGAFSGEHLAELLGQSKAELARHLLDARTALRPQFATES